MRRLITVLCVVAFVSLLFSAACGRSRSLVTADSGVFSSREAQSAEQPQWLTDALAELDAMACPMNVRSEVFADLKARQREVLLERASGKGVRSTAS